MPRLRFGSNVIATIDAVQFHLEALVLDATLQSLTGTEAILTFRPGSTELTYTLTGIDLDSSPGPGGATGLSGEATGLRVEAPSGLLVEIDRLSLSLSDLTAAALDDRSGQAPAAVENIVLDLDWIYRGTPQGTFQPRDGTNDDGVVMNMRGDDVAVFAEGADIFWLGDGNDFARGGEGDDGLAGGKGRDILLGERGADALEGDADNDLLLGGKDGDLLKGGTGNDIVLGQDGVDVLEGGAGFDLLIGGKGEDSFRFFEGDGVNVILDFEEDADLILFEGDQAEVRLTEIAAGTMIRGEDLSVLVLNATTDSFDEGNLLFL